MAEFRIPSGLPDVITWRGVGAGGCSDTNHVIKPPPPGLFARRCDCGRTVWFGTARADGGADFDVEDTRP